MWNSLLKSAKRIGVQRSVCCNAGHRTSRGTKCSSLIVYSARVYQCLEIVAIHCNTVIGCVIQTMLRIVTCRLNFKINRKGNRIQDPVDWQVNWLSNSVFKLFLSAFIKRLPGQQQTLSHRDSRHFLCGSWKFTSPVSCFHLQSCSLLWFTAGKLIDLHSMRYESKLPVYNPVSIIALTEPYRYLYFGGRASFQAAHCLATSILFLEFKSTKLAP